MPWVDDINMTMNRQYSDTHRQSDIDLLLLGANWHGKSSTGNSIVGRKSFKCKKGPFDAVTTDIRYQYSEHEGRVLKVVDTPGLSVRPYGRLQKRDVIDNAMMLSPAGYHAFLLIISYKYCLIGLDKVFVDFCRDSLGVEEFRHRCIVVITGGDKFEKKNDVDFDEWCRGQKNVLGDLLKELNYRVVLFNNKTKSKARKKKQLGELMEIVDSIPTVFGEYFF